MRNSFKTGLLLISWLVAKLCLVPQRPQVLMYHSFDTTGWKYGVSPADLEKQIQYLKQQRDIVPLSAIVAHHTGEQLVSEKAVAVTIDDGYRDTFEVFFPLAKQYNIPFTLFLTTDLTITDTFGNLERPTVAMITEMLESGLMTIGLHGHTHMHFDTAFAEDMVSTEIEMSERYIEETFGVSPQFVAYPSGRYTAEVLEYFRQKLGYRAGFSIKSGSVRSSDDPFLMRRIEVSRNIPDFLSFKLRLTPAIELYNAIIKIFKK